jgi:phosphoribosyl-ATP pyrophosphohydrolase/phosphoribosyl-AMP cyclohydrolase
MILPSIDVMNGRAVQLVGGAGEPTDVGDPLELVERFGRLGLVPIVDLDAALGRGQNTELIREMLRRARCRVGGGIRSVEAALDWLDAGADSIVLGTMARPEILRELPRERVIAALDARDGEVVDHGWTRGTVAGSKSGLQSSRLTWRVFWSPLSNARDACRGPTCSEPQICVLCVEHAL